MELNLLELLNINVDVDSVLVIAAIVVGMRLILSKTSIVEKMSAEGLKLGEAILSLILSVVALFAFGEGWTGLMSIFTILIVFVSSTLLAFGAESFKDVFVAKSGTSTN